MNSPYELLTGLALLREKKRCNEQTGDHKLNAWSALIIRMDDVICAVHQSDVEEILTQDKLTQVTGVAPWLAGLGFFQGKLLNVIDGWCLLNTSGERKNYQLSAATVRILVVHGDKEWFGLKVSELISVRHVWSDDVDHVPPREGIWASYVGEWVRIEGKLLPVLKLKELVLAVEGTGTIAFEGQ